MKIVSFSDTHNLHEGVKLPKCDIAIFCGDYSGRGNKFETLNFLRWYSNQNQCRYKIMIPGNHDICFDEKYNGETHAQNWLKKFIEKHNNIIILHNSSINIEGINIWGSPVTTWYHGDRWAFNMHDEDIHQVWETIPVGTDIVVTHGPVYGIHDTVFTGHHVGCNRLGDVLFNKIKPKYHLCGHIHESYGKETNDGITFINCSIVNLEYERTNKPISFNIK
jgi:Icc-related predicted phosphoesterase